MHPLVIHIACGQSFFSGFVILLIGIYLRHSHQEKKRTARLASLMIVFGLLLAGISATPFPPTVWLLLTGSALMMLRRHWGQRNNMAMLAVGIWVAATAFELPRHFTPRLSDESVSRRLPVVVLADSVTAGLGEGEAVTWPTLLRNESEVDVTDLSHVGETVASALKRIRQHPLPQSAVFILELGGNDILGSTSIDRFAKDLDELLSYLRGDQRTVFLFELPLPPFHNRWGKFQRDLCSKHGVLLIPKHQLASVFEGDTSTLDSIHLSQEGHNRMLSIVQEILRH